jgi:hypothetical protein
LHHFCSFFHILQNPMCCRIALCASDLFEKLTTN